MLSLNANGTFLIGSPSIVKSIVPFTSKNNFERPCSFINKSKKLTPADNNSFGVIKTFVGILESKCILFYRLF